MIFFSNFNIFYLDISEKDSTFADRKNKTIGFKLK